jgi:hypothetical protein
MRNEELSQAATDLWLARWEIIEIHGRLEDDDGGLGPRNDEMEKKFSDVIERLDDLALFVHEADPDRAKRGDTPPWSGSDGLVW